MIQFLAHLNTCIHSKRTGYIAFLSIQAASRLSIDLSNLHQQDADVHSLSWEDQRKFSKIAFFPSYFTSSISLPKLSTTSYLTCSGANFLLMSSKNLRAHLILVFSISRSSMLDIEPLVSATK